MVRQSVQSGRSVGAIPQPDDDADGDRSVLAAPIFVRKRAVACVLAVHTRIRHLFGRDEERLGDFIASIDR